ncbi:MAG: LysE family transporter [Ignavibacteriaceae bacterium]|nr:LysE family transporter [Ignavibacteriaceae bacterium]
MGFVAGFILSIPVAGPINILITSNALLGKLRYCLLVAVGSSIIEFFYVLVIVFGIVSLYEIYKPFVPYILIIGSIVLIIVGIRVMRTKFDITHINLKEIVRDKIANKGGFLTGILINLTNPSLFLGWLSSTFIIFSLASSLNLNTGGLDIIVKENLDTIQKINSEQKSNEKINTDIMERFNNHHNGNELNPLVLSFIYAASLSIGSLVWLNLYTRFIVKFRNKLKISLISLIIKLLGFGLVIIGIFLAYNSINLFMVH